jgi:phage protein D/phage baseplate assembly protein gpV
MTAQRSSNLFDVKVDGTPLPREVAGNLIEGLVEDELNLPDAFELVFHDPLRTALKAGGFEIGKPLTISVVSEAAPEGKVILNGEITALEAEIERDRTTTIVRGYDPSHRLQHGTLTETHLDVSYSDIVAKVAQRHKLTMGERGTNNVIHPAVMQWNQTDWEFVNTLASEIGHEVVIVDGKLDLRPPIDSSSAPGDGDLRAADARKLVVGGNVLRLRAAVSGAEQVDQVSVRGWDFKKKEAVEGTAKATDGARSASAGMGAADLASKVGGGTLVKVDLPVESVEVAQNVADSLVQQLGSAAAELDGTVYGNGELRAGVSVSLTGAGAPFDGKYTLTSVRHTFNQTAGYLTSFRVSGRQTRTMLGLVRGKQSGHQGVNGVVPAIVTNVDDPEKLGRVKVSFPWLADKSESFWARVSTLGAGDKRGIVILPEVGDEVLVAFDHGDARLPYVVGSLYNGKDKMPVEPVKSGKIVTRAWVSRNGHRFEMHDEDDVVTIATGDGKHKFVLDQKNSKIVLDTTGDVEVKSKGKVGFAATGALKLETQDKLELKAAAGISIDAGGGPFEAKGVSAKVEGSGNAELSSSGTLAIRGSLVTLN